MALLEQLDLIKLLPFVAAFGIAFLLYVFDRLVLTLGHTMPPRPIWRGSLVAHVPEYLLRSLWQLLARPKYLRSIEVEVDRLVNIARAEQKDFLLGSLTYGESRFRFAANLFAYGKSALVWSTACVVWAVAANQRPTSVIVGLGVVWLSASVFCVVALALETHFLVENAERRARIAEAMLHLRGNHIEPGTEFDSDGYETIDSAVAVERSRRLIGLSWGSLENLRSDSSFQRPNNGMQRTAPSAAADAERQAAGP